MHPVFWKVLSAILLLCLIAQNFSWQAPGLPESLFDKPTSPTTTTDDSWTYDWERDGNNHGLSTEQCDLAFPDLYNEIDRAVTHWRSRKITSDSIELFKGNDGGLRVLIVDQQLRIIRTKGLHRNDFRQRIIALLQQIQRSITAAEYTGERIPNIEFTIAVDDKPLLDEVPSPLWAFTRSYANVRHDSIWIIPDFHFFGAPPEAEGWQQTQTLAREHDAPLEDKIPKVVWRGVKWTNQALRQSLLDETEGQSWADVKVMDWAKPGDRVPMEEFCKYRYTINTEGRSWSARMTNLLNCDSLLMVHDVEWIAHYYHLLDTGVNCVRVERDFSNLEEKVLYYNNHTAEAQLIADTARKTFRERYTTPAATACYWRRLMRSWRTVSFEPETRNDTMKDQQQSPSGLRGISFEEFIVHDNTRDYPYPMKHRVQEKPHPKLHP